MFVLDTDPVQSARYHCDIHVRSSLTHLAQILSTAHHRDPNPTNYHFLKDFIYPAIKGNSRYVDWTCACLENYGWLASMAEELCREYVKRNRRAHESMLKIRMLAKYSPALPATDYRVHQQPAYFPIVHGLPLNCIVRLPGNFVVASFGLLVERRADTEQYFVDAVASNRNFYNLHHSRKAKWHKGAWQPPWFAPPGSKPPVNT